MAGALDGIVARPPGQRSVHAAGHSTAGRPAPKASTRRIAGIGRALGSGVLCVCLSGGLSLACSKSTSSPHPRGALDAYTDALREGRTRDAYELLSVEAKRTMSFEAFERMVRDNPSELKALLDALERPTADPYVTARITAPDGESLLMVYEDGAWRIDASAVDLFGQRTPEQAVRSFLRAFEGRRYDILLRFVPDAHREGLDAEKLKEAWEGEQKEEMAQLVSALAAGLAEAQVELVGDRATLAYGSGGTVELLREHGSWKIEDFR